MRLASVTQAPVRLGFLMALVFVGALDQTVIASALPALLSDLRVPFTHLDSASWLITAYLLGYVAVMPVAGRVADAVGRRPVILGALTIFAVGSLGASLCQSLLTLDLMRGVQAVGGGALLPVCLAMIGDAFPADRRGLPLGLVGAAAELGGVAGPPWGAAIIGHWGWRAVFLVNVPLCLVLAIITLALPASRAWTLQRGALDLRGALLLAAALAAFAGGAASGGSGSLTSNPTTGANRLLLIPCALLLLAFWRVERSSSTPLIPPDVLRKAGVVAAGVANTLLGVVLITVLVDVPVYAAAVLQWTPDTAGLLLIRFMIFLPVGALAGGWLSDRIGQPVVAVTGFLLTALAFQGMAQWTAHPSSLLLTVTLAAGGGGIGLVTAPVAGGALGSFASTATGTAASLVTALRIVGMMGGLAVLTTWGTWRFQQIMSHVPFPLLNLSTNHAMAARQIASYQTAFSGAAVTVFSGIFAAGVVVCLAGCLPALLLGTAASTDG